MQIDAMQIDAAPPDAASKDIQLEFADSTLPSALGWTFGSDCTHVDPSGVALTEAEAISLNAGFLHLDTTAPSTTFADAYYTRNGNVDASHGWSIEARLRITSMEAPPPSNAQGFALLVAVGGEEGILQVGDHAVLTTDTSSAAVDTSQFHVYRMSRALGASMYTVEVDGNIVLTSAPLTAEVSANQITFGDSTCQARNGVVDVDYVRFAQP